jgi:hypothetical protein
MLISLKKWSSNLPYVSNQYRDEFFLQKPFLPEFRRRFSFDQRVD